MSLNKITTVLSGILNDSDFNYVCFIAENLSEMLPNFSVKKIAVKSDDWKDWIEQKCKTHGWFHTESPLIWRESGVCGGTFNYVGDKCAFVKLVNNYYGVNCELSELEQKNLNLDYMKARYLNLDCNSKKFDSKPLKITISGAGRSVCPDLVVQLATMKEMSDNGIEINLYDTPGHFFKIKDIVKDAIAIGSKLTSIKILDNLSEGLPDCDILLILDHITREDSEELPYWLQKNHIAAKELAKQINVHAPSDMKVILCSMGPTCLWANIIAKVATKLKKNCIVVVSMHYGLEMMYDFLDKLEISKKDVSCPPVWGFLGINHYVDLHHAIHKCRVFMPNEKAIFSSNNSTLPVGTEYIQLRWLRYLAFNKKPHVNLTRRKGFSSYHVGRSEDFQKCKAICDLLKLWYQKDESNIGDHIITLGISSDGHFGIAKNIFFSQPVFLKILEDNSRVWVPCPKYPLPIDSLILKSLIETAKIILENMNLMD